MMGVTLINNIGQLTAGIHLPVTCRITIGWQTLHSKQLHCQMASSLTNGYFPGPNLTFSLSLRNACPQLGVMTPVNTKASRHSLFFGQVKCVLLPCSLSSLTGINSAVRADRKLTYDLTCCASSDHYLRNQPCLKVPLSYPLSLAYK